jgi:hypothetical protein
MRFFAEFILSGKRRFFASLRMIDEGFRMTREGLRMTESEGLRMTGKRLGITYGRLRIKAYLSTKYHTST